MFGFEFEWNYRWPLLAILIDVVYEDIRVDEKRIFLLAEFRESGLGKEIFFDDALAPFEIGRTADCFISFLLRIFVQGCRL